MSLNNRQKLFIESIPTYSPFSFLLAREEKEVRPLIKPLFSSPLGVEIDFTLYVSFIEQILHKIVPPDLLFQLKAGDSEASIFQQLNGLLPLFIWDIPDVAPTVISCTVLCQSEFTHGLGRYVSDSVSRWLVPGKFLAICSVNSLNFQFCANSHYRYFVHQLFLEVDDHRELSLIKSHVNPLTQEIRLNILAVKHARQVSAIKKLSTDEKRAMIQENIASALNKRSKDFDKSLFDQMHQILLKISAEDKVNDKFVPFLKQRQKIFDRDIFNDIRHYVLLFRDKFTAIREMHHVSRLVSLLYLFKKMIEQKIQNAPHERHISLKFLKTKLHHGVGKKTVIGVLGSINVIRENEVLEEKHILEACQHCVKGIRRIKDSYVADHRGQDKIRLFYLEIEKEDGSVFSLEEMKEMQKRLPKELKAKMENGFHPVFMPRNEEEVIRNIVILSRQLKYTKDIPQVVISFDTQTEKEISFTVILLRLLKENTLSLKEIFSGSQSLLTIHNLETKEVGLLRKKHPKEANIFSVRLSKRPFLRKDYTLDLLKARQAVANELLRILGEMRDYNGGILAKQHEVFTQLQRSLEIQDPMRDFLLENFFYSLTPPIQQSLLSPTLLKSLFLMLEKVSLEKEAYSLQTLSEKEFFLLLIGSSCPTFKERLFSKVSELKIPPSDLSFTCVRISDKTYVGYIFRCEKEEKRAAFLEAIRSFVFYEPKEKISIPAI